MPRAYRHVASGHHADSCTGHSASSTLHSGGMPLSPDPPTLEIQKPTTVLTHSPLQQQCGPCKRAGQSPPPLAAPSWGSSPGTGEGGSPLAPTCQGSCQKSPHFCVRFETASKCQVRLLTLVLISTAGLSEAGDACAFPLGEKSPSAPRSPKVLV